MWWRRWIQRRGKRSHATTKAQHWKSHKGRLALEDQHGYEVTIRPSLSSRECGGRRGGRCFDPAINQKPLVPRKRRRLYGLNRSWMHNKHALLRHKRLRLALSQVRKAQERSGIWHHLARLQSAEHCVEAYSTSGRSQRDAALLKGCYMISRRKEPPGNGARSSNTLSRHFRTP